MVEKAVAAALRPARERLRAAASRQGDYERILPTFEAKSGKNVELVAEEK